MATEVQVFGNPMTKSTLAGSPEYAAKGATISSQDVAAATLQFAMRDAAGRPYVREGLRNGELGKGLVTLSLLNNFTGEALSFIASHRADDVVPPHPFPPKLENGQSLAFQTPKGPGQAVVYRGKNEAGADFDWLLAWSNNIQSLAEAGTPVAVNKVYTEIHEPRQVYDADKYWNEMLKKLEEVGSNEIGQALCGFTSTATISPGDISTVEGTLLLDGVNVDYDV